MAGDKGTATVDFGAMPGSSQATVAVTGQAAFTSGNSAEAWMMGDSTADHNSDEHKMVPLTLRIGDYVTGTGFTIYATYDGALTGQFTVRWAWSS